MKFAAHPTTKSSAAVGVALLLLLGCKAEPTRAAEQQTAGAPAASGESETSTSAENSANPAVEPVPVENFVIAPDTLSPGLADIIKLAEGGLSDAVLIAFIENWPQPFSLTAEEILYLTDLGISEEVIGAMIKHGGDGTAKSEPPALTTPEQPIAESAPVPAPASGTGVVQSAPGVSITATPEFESGVQPPQQTVIVETPTVVPPVEYNHFYTALSPYGTWIEVADYGVCWRPTVAVINPGWRPYSHRGRWLYTDAGWYWQSDYSWGWAPFHYGRWSLHPHHGWVWAPDRVWGPAWVTWRYSDAYCGWAPLPPGAYVTERFGFTYHRSRVSFSFGFGLGHHHYTFLPINRFCDRDPWHYYVPSAHVVNIYNRTKIINNIYVNNENTVVNDGISRDHVARATHREIRKVEVRDLPAGKDSSARPDRLGRQGSELVVYRPQLPSPTDNAKARRPEGTATVVPSRSSLIPSQSARDLAGNGGPGAVRSELSKVSGPSADSIGGVRSAAGGVATIPSRPASANTLNSANPGLANNSSGIINQAGPTSRSLQTVRPGSSSRVISSSPLGVRNESPARTPSRDITANSFKSATEDRGRISTQPQLIRTPVQSSPNPQLGRSPALATAPSRTTPRTSVAPAVPPQIQPSRANSSVTQAPTLQNRSVEAPKRVESRQFVPVTRGFPSQQQGPTLVPSRSLNQSYQAPSIPQTPRTPPNYTVTPNRSNIAPATRQELHKPPTSVYTQKELASPYRGLPQRSNVGTPSFEGYRSRTIPSSPQIQQRSPAPSYAPPTPRTPPSNIQVVPSTRSYSAPPTAIRPSQMTPSVRSAPQPATASPSRGRGRSEIQK